jgi:hypothetical protein
MSIRQHIPMTKVTFLMVLFWAICCAAITTVASTSSYLTTGSHGLPHLYTKADNKAELNKDFYYLIPSDGFSLELQSEAEFLFEEEDSNEEDNTYASSCSDHLGNFNSIKLASSYKALYFELVSLIQLYILYQSLRIFIA